MTTSTTYDVNPSRPGGPEMFDRIAKRYDRLNRVLSFGLDRRWRKNLVNSIAPIQEGGVILDLATGTADVALSVARAYPQARVIGLDPSEGMLGVGHQKVDRAALEGRVELVVGRLRVELPPILVRRNLWFTINRRSGWISRSMPKNVGGPN